MRLISKVIIVSARRFLAAADWALSAHIASPVPLGAAQQSHQPTFSFINIF